MVVPERELSLRRSITTVSEIASVCSGAEIIQRGLTADIDAVVCDTRDISKAQTLFCAVVGGGAWYGSMPGDSYRFDFHKYIPLATQRGTASILLERVETEVPQEVSVIKVPNVIRALGELTRYRIESNSIQVVGVTGSTGKSTVCELVAQVLRVKWPTYKGLTDRSTPISLPRMLLNSSLSELERVVVEMPMDGLGQIRQLCKIAPPQYAVVLNVNDSHIKQLGSIGAIVKAKAEIVESLSHEGVAILNYDDELVREIQNRSGGRVVFFGKSEGVDVRATDIETRLTGTSFNLEIGGEKRGISLSLLGNNSVYSALAAASVGVTSGLWIDEICEGLEAFKPLPSRLSVLKGKNGSIVLDDTRLATPASSLLMLSSIAEIPRRGENRILVQGAIMRSYQHEGIKTEVFDVITRGFDLVLLVGEAYNQFFQAIRLKNPNLHIECLGTPEEAGTKASRLCSKGDLIVVNGSEQSHMEAAVEKLVFEEEIDKIDRK